jgi:glycosyltransferase involved in cell wall biosynthesis
VPASVSRDADLPRISIVVPSLNHGAFIEHALRSVLDQRYPHLELIVVDGGSRDGTREVLERFDGQVTRWVSEPDSGPAAALNRGFAMTTGHVLGVLNADDFLLPGSLAAVAAAFAARPDTDVISGQGYFSGPDGALAIPAYSDPWNLRHFRYGACVLLQPATFFRRAAFERAGGFRTTGRVCWDMELWADMARTGARFATIETRLAAFRLHPKSITARSDQQARRRRDAREVAAELNGGRQSIADTAFHYWHRALKFARHPRRAVRQRLYFRSTLRRWSL